MSFKVWLLIKLFKSLGFSVCLVAEDEVSHQRAILFAHSYWMADGLAYRLLKDTLDLDALVVPKKKAAARRAVVLH